MQKNLIFYYKIDLAFATEKVKTTTFLIKVLNWLKTVYHYATVYFFDIPIDKYYLKVI